MWEKTRKSVKMPVDVLLGLQWGDEGKGKIVDLLSERYNAVARFQGGPNAGHTLVIKDKKYILHTLPSGIIHPQITNIIGSGMVIDPIVLKSEIDKLSVDIDLNLENLMLSTRAHLILPTHKLLDAAYESNKGESKIGSTLKGIGPAYTDKIARIGLRIGDILEADFDKKYKQLKEHHLRLLENYVTEVDLSMEGEWFNAIDEMRSLKIAHTELAINNLLSENKEILAEGAQGTLLDISFGTYPYVTSSNTICSESSSGLGFSPKSVRNIIGVFKAYTTRVGSGPFPTELKDTNGDKLRNEGHEFGSTTGRPRRCGWLDLVALKYAVMINGVNQLAITKADVLDSFEIIKIGEKYNSESNQNLEFPDILKCKSVKYNSRQGWNEKISEHTNYTALPQAFKDYMQFLEESTSTPINLISVGPERNQTIYK